MTLKFDPKANFIASRPLMVSGIALERGDAFDASLVSVRKLQMLWESRHVCYDWQFNADHQPQQNLLSEPKVERRGRPRKYHFDEITEENNA